MDAKRYAELTQNPMVIALIRRISTLEDAIDGVLKWQWEPIVNDNPLASADLKACVLFDLKVLGVARGSRPVQD